jgi:hypothetical protein
MLILPSFAKLSSQLVFIWEVTNFEHNIRLRYQSGMEKWETADD